MKHAVQTVALVNLAAFAALAIVTVHQWRSRRSAAAAWAAASFVALGAVVILGRLPVDNLAERIVQRIDIAILLGFPYLLFRFTRTFGRADRRLERLVSAMSLILVAWTFALPRIPRSGEAQPAWFRVYLVAFLFHFAVLLVVVAVRLWRAGRQQPTVARRRMQLLAFAAGAITLALLLSTAGGEASALTLAAQLLALASATAFWLGLAPPRLVRGIWRRRENERLQGAIGELMAFATSQEELSARVLRPTVEIVGARAVVIRNAEGVVVGARGVPEHVLSEIEAGAEPSAIEDDTEVVEIEAPGATLVVWTSPYAPYFGEEELRLLRTLAALTGLALDRARLFAQEHQTRVALERTDELKTNFVALAAHELRTPVTTIHGFVQTLHALGDRLPDEQRDELRRALEQQTARMALLVEQLLDLSRLDADAIEIAPQRLLVRERLDELVRAAAGADADAVEIDSDPSIEAWVDPNAFDRIVSNLVTNAFRYGKPPVIVRAERSDRHLRISVEDRGTGVAPEFVPDLFERFSRSESSRGSGVTGTGLGLAIARSYARAHRGELRYEDADPSGARFQLVLPAEPDVAAHRRR